MSRDNRNKQQDILSLCRNPREYFMQSSSYGGLTIITKTINTLGTESINTDITVGSGLFRKGQTRSIFGHILKNWDSIITDADGTDFSAKKQTLLMQNLLTTDNIKRSNGNDYTRLVKGESERFNGPGADAFLQKASGKYMFEYLLESKAPKQVIETVIFSGKEKQLDFDAIIERVSRQGGNPDQKAYMLNALKARQLQEAITSNNIKKVSQCLDRIKTQEQFQNIAMLANPNTVSSASSILLADSIPTQEDLETVSSNSSQSFSSEELSEGTGQINQSIHDFFTTKEYELFDKPLDDLMQIVDNQSKKINTKMSALYDSSLLSSNDELKELEQELEELSAEADLSDPPPSSQQTQSASDKITDEMLMAELEVLEAEYQGEKYDKISTRNEEEIKKSEQKLDKLEEQFDKKWTTIVSNSKNGHSEISK
jgi:hypothetical protein